MLPDVDELRPPRHSAIYGLRENVISGGLVSYDTNLTDQYGRAVVYVEFTAAKTRLINLRVAEREGKLIEWPIGQRPLHTALNRLMKSLGGAP